MSRGCNYFMILILNCIHVTMNNGVCVHVRRLLSNSQLFIKLFTSIQAIIIKGC